MYSGGVPTRHTQMGRPTYEAPTREYYTHKHTQTQTNTQRGPTKYGAEAHAVAAPSYLIHPATGAVLQGRPTQRERAQ